MANATSYWILPERLILTTKDLDMNTSVFSDLHPLGTPALNTVNKRFQNKITPKQGLKYCIEYITSQRSMLCFASVCQVDILHSRKDVVLL